MVSRRMRVNKTKRKIDALTNMIAKEYGKANPSRTRIATLSNRAGKLLTRIKKIKR